jgi:aspartyl aminopeptidase
MPDEATNTTLGKAFARSEEQWALLRASGVAAAKRLLGFIDASPTPYHAVSNLAAQLDEDGFMLLDERDAWTLAPGDRRYLVRDGSTLVGFVVGARAPAEAGFRVLGAHTDSPALRLKPQPEVTRRGYLQLGVEIYGGVLLSTWLDRDLSLAGRLHCREDDGSVHARLVDLRRPVGRVSSLALHLDRKVNTDGLVLNPQRHMVPIVGLGEAVDLDAELAAAVGVASERILGRDLVLYDTQRGALGGLDDAFVFSPRLDNLASCFAAAEALCGAPDGIDATAVIVLYDHEECGSRSALGAASTLLSDVLGRIALAYPTGQVQALPRAIARSLCVSADMAHALHPNHTDKHDDEHAPQLNRGLVIKTNANQSYATSGATAAFFTDLCHQVGYEPQHFVTRADLPCGSTIGPIIAAALGIRAVDVGAPMLGMHSCRELAGTLDVLLAAQTYQRLFQ